jgi:hypothetical protein
VLPDVVSIISLQNLVKPQVRCLQHTLSKSLLCIAEHEECQQRRAELQRTIKFANTNTNDLLDSDGLQACAGDKESNVLASELEALELGGTPEKERRSALQSMVDPVLLAVGKLEQALGWKDPWDNCHIAKRCEEGSLIWVADDTFARNDPWLPFTRARDSTGQGIH